MDIEKVGKSSPSEKSSMTFIFEPKDLVPFEMALKWQREWQKKLLIESFSVPAVWFLQHQSCYTLGRGASTENLYFDVKFPPAELFRIDRGGEVTHHLPGQLVVYPVLDLRCFKPDLNWYLRELEEVLIEVLAILGFSGERIPGLTGIWVEGYKVASIGISCRRWITQHGFALNIACDLKGFDLIVPCGLKGSKVGCLSQWEPGITVEDVQPLVRACFSKKFNFQWIRKKSS